MAVFTWGLGKSGQLGTGKNENCELPQLVFPMKKNKDLTVATDIGAGALFTAWVSDGKLNTTGCGKYGRRGTGNETDVNLPTVIELDSPILQISCGSWHACALTEDGRLFIWGYGKSHGVLGISNPQLIDAVYTAPVSLSLPVQAKISGVSCGHNFTLAWGEEGKAFSWGSNHHGVLGHGNTDDVFHPRKIDGLHHRVITFMDAGRSHSAAVSSDGKILMFGKGKDGALGLTKSDLKDKSSPIQVETLDTAHICKASCSVGEHHCHTLAVTCDGAVFAWGDGYKGKLGLGDQGSRYVPTIIPAKQFNGEKIIDVSAGGIHSAALSAEGHVFTWGCGSDGRLGHPESKGHRYLFRSDTPRTVDDLLEKGRCVKVKTSYYHTVALFQ